MYKLIALDMDGTVLKNDKTISVKTIEAIKAATLKGLHVVLCTGRPLNRIKKYLNDLNLLNDKNHVICLNGALVQDTTNNVISSFNLTHEDFNLLCDLSDKLNVHIQGISPDADITHNRDVSKYTVRHSLFNDMKLKIVDKYNLPENIIINKVMFIDDKNIIDRVIKELPEWVYERFTVVRSSDVFLEILNKKASKGLAVSLLSDHLGLKQSEVICVGDAENDISMIKYAGLGVAMENAFPEVKEVADFITSSNEEDGVAKVIEEFML